MPGGTLASEMSEQDLKKSIPPGEGRVASCDRLDAEDHGGRSLASVPTAMAIMDSESTSPLATRLSQQADQERMTAAAKRRKETEGSQLNVIGKERLEVGLVSWPRVRRWLAKTSGLRTIILSVGRNPEPHKRLRRLHH
jgi:hypothetical protein